jgi:putative DNA methylase
MKGDGRRLIEDYLPIQAISAEASREKSVRKGHISTLHLWWARRPLVACRAAVYGALVPADQFQPANAPEEKRASLGRANAAKFVQRLCRYPSDSKPQEKTDIERAIAEAQRHILEAHAERLSQELGKPVTAEDILEGRAPRPKVLDMFAGGGAIPLEALRLGCEAYALDLNPVAHIIELCTLVYPQQYGRPDPQARGCAKDGTWAGLAEEVWHWGEWVLKKVKAEIGDLYPLIPDPEFKGEGEGTKVDLWQQEAAEGAPPGYLVPVAYLWTRTVQCKNPSCQATVPLVKQTWLCKKEGRYVALRVVAPKGEKRVRFAVVEAKSAAGLGFDPEAGSKGGNATCPFCGTVADSGYVKEEGYAGRMGQQLMAVACTRPGARGKVYLAADEVPQGVPVDEAIRGRIEALCERTGLTVPGEPIEANPRSMDIQHFGFKTWDELFTLRQMLCLLTLTAKLRDVEKALRESGYVQETVTAILTSLGVLVDRVASQGNNCCVYHTGGEKVENSLGARSLPMVWDFVEANPLGSETGSAANQIDWIASAYTKLAEVLHSANVARGSASQMPFSDVSFDTIITDPPYYDSVSYSNLSDFFYVWLKRTVGYLYPEHFASEATPKKNEIIAAFYRHGGDKAKSRTAYETMMAQAFREAHRVLKPGGQMVVVYAHKTTLGWTTLVDALRAASFTVTEAWPLDTEMKAGKVKTGKAMLASSIFLVARKRQADQTGAYEEEVRPALEFIVRERVASLWDMGITGADLVIAAVGAGLRAFTRYARVEYANGEEVPAERFLTEVETVVLESLLDRLSKEVGGNGRYSLAGVDPATRFYTLWRYTYRTGELDAGEAIVFANGTHVELDGQGSLSAGARALIEKKKGKYRLRDYAERGEDEKLGLPGEEGQTAPLIDTLHRTLWLMEHRPAQLGEFLQEAQPNREQLRLVAQALAGPALKGGELGEVSPSGELAALARLTANWRAVVEVAEEEELPLFAPTNGG